MAKIQKVYPGFFNGVSEQPPELVLDNQCKSMENCVPDLIKGLTKRNPAVYQGKLDALDSYSNSTLFHEYDRGEDDEEYLFYATGDNTEPLVIYTKDGVKGNITYDSPDYKDYLASLNLKGLTVQDTTWLVNRDKIPTINTTNTTASKPNYDKEAFYWLSRGSGDRYNPYNYAVYINDVVFACNPDKPSGTDDDPETGFEDSDFAAKYLTDVINGSYSSDPNAIPDYIRAVHIGSIIKIYLAQISTPLFRLGSASYEHVWIRKDGKESLKSVKDYTTSHDLISGNAELWCTFSGTTEYFNIREYLDANPSTISITVPYYTTGATSPTDLSPAPENVTMDVYYNDIDNLDFTFNSWDSWGDQASSGWKGSVNKITDLPKDMVFEDVYVEIQGDDNNNFTSYYVKWNGSSWEETADPTENRGEIDDLPLKVTRTDILIGVPQFEVTAMDKIPPRVGNTENNPDPSFVGQKISDIFFYKNRFGISSGDSVILSETANYDNFYIQTALEVLDSDPIDISLASSKASKIYFVKPFNNSLYIFTKDSQYELTSDSIFSPNYISLQNVTNYPMSTVVEPVVLNDSLFFISNSNNRQQLREYRKQENLSVSGLDLNITTPTYIDKPITKILADGVLGYVLCCTDDTDVYLYKFKEDGVNRVQSSWCKWKFYEGVSINKVSYAYLDTTLVISYVKGTTTRLAFVLLDDINVDNKVDIDVDTNENLLNVPYNAEVVLHDFYPHLVQLGNPIDKILLKRVTIQGEGKFDASIYRRDYNRTFTKSSTLGLKNLNFHVSSKVNNVEITIRDNSEKDFVITSMVLEGMLSPRAREIK